MSRVFKKKIGESVNRTNYGLTCSCCEKKKTTMRGVGGELERRTGGERFFSDQISCGSYKTWIDKSKSRKFQVKLS